MLIASVFILIPETKAQNVSAKDFPVRLEYSITTDYDRDDDFSTNCADFAHTLRIGGYLIFLVKIILPFIIMIKASMNMMTIVTNGDPGELKKQAKKVVTSLIASIIIFFLPTLLNTMFGFISNFSSNRTEDSKICSACIFEPFSSTCTDYSE